MFQTIAVQMEKEIWLKVVKNTSRSYSSKTYSLRAEFREYLSDKYIIRVW